MRCPSMILPTRRSARPAAPIHRILVPPTLGMRPRPDAGKILSQTFSVFFGNLPSLGLIILIVLLPVMIANAWNMSETMDGTAEPMAAVVIGALSLILTPIATGALTYGVFQAMRDNKLAVGDCLSVGLKRMLPVLGISLVVGLLTALGMMACIIPGLFVMTIWSAAVPTAVIENSGVGASLTRSFELTKGYRWIVFGVIFVFWLISVFLSMGVTFALFATLGDSLLIMILLQSLVTLITSGLQATYPALIYYHLRAAKETIDLDEIAAVFD